MKLLLPTFLILFFSISLLAKSPENNSSLFVGVNVDSLIIATSQQSGTAHIGGIWTATTDGATVGIIQANDWQRITGTTIPQEQRTLAQQWVIILLDSPDPYLQPGTLMGWLTSAAKPNHYNAQIFTKRKNNKLVSSKPFTLQLVDDGHLSMKAIKKGIAVSPWRLLPYMLRRSIKYIDETPRDLDGFLRKWPTPNHPQIPGYL